MKVIELMLRDLTSVDPDDTIRTLVEILESAETSSIPVTDTANRVVGIISEHDVLSAAVPRYMEILQSASFMPNFGQLETGLNRIAEQSVSHYMDTNPISVRDDEEDIQAADLMLRHKLRLLPVVNREEELVGVVRRVDLFKHVL